MDGDQGFLQGLEPEGVPAAGQPLAARMRPRTLDEFAGQKHLLGEGKVLRRLIAADTVSSMIFFSTSFDVTLCVPSSSANSCSTLSLLRSDAYLFKMSKPRSRNDDFERSHR